MTIKSSKIRIVLAFMALFLFQFAVLVPVSADLTEVETNKQGLNKTEPGDGSSGELVESGDSALPWWKKALNELGDIGEGLVDGWNRFKDWAADEWNQAWDTVVEFGKEVWGDIEDFFEAIGDWFSENEWAQTLLAGILAAAIIIGTIALLVFFGVIAIPVGIVAGLIILAGTLIGGFTYQWLAGDNYSFWGAFGSSLVGGILAYVGYATGAFAAAIGWLRTVAWPAAVNWWRTAAWPWLRGRPAAIWGWMRGTAWPWIRGTAWPWLRGKAVAAYNWARTNPVISKMIQGAKFGAMAGAFSSLLSAPFAYFINGENYSLKSFLIDTLAGGITGAILAPFIVTGATLGLAAIAGLGIYGGVENYIVGGLKDGEWSNWGNFVVGFGVSILSIKILGGVIESLLRRVPVLDNTISIDTSTKTIEEVIKSGIKKGNEEINEFLEKMQNNQGDINDSTDNNSKTQPNDTSNPDEKSEQQESKEVQGNDNSTQKGTNGQENPTTNEPPNNPDNHQVPPHSSGANSPAINAMY